MEKHAGMPVDFFHVSAILYDHQQVKGGDRQHMDQKSVLRTGKKEKPVFRRAIPAVCLAVYLLAVLWYTVAGRKIGYYSNHFQLFWSYREWFGGNRETGRQILANIAMFLPFGFLLAALGKKKQPIFLFFALSLLFSALIETAQLVLLRGFFELDDIFNNMTGGVLGALLCRLLRRLLPGKMLRAAVYAACAGIVLTCGALYFFSDRTEKNSQNALSQGLCFQVEQAEVQEDRLRLRGVCFWYERGPSAYSIVLRSTRTGARRPLQTECGIPRPDVAAYFCRDSAQAGFEAAGTGIAKGEEYEIVLHFGPLLDIPTGTYLTAGPSGADLHYVPAAAFQPLDVKGTDLEKIVSDGILRVYKPENHMYVYWYADRLYWIADEGFSFEDDKSTRLEMLLWTTQTDQLSEKSRNIGKTWDSFGVYFEKYELQGNFGRYRVCARELPVDYPVTSIKTGYYSRGWIWSASFWPVFRFTR